jgi:hypothetical protein
MYWHVDNRNIQCLSRFKHRRTHAKTVTGNGVNAQSGACNCAKLNFLRSSSWLGVSRGLTCTTGCRLVPSDIKWYLQNQWRQIISDGGEREGHSTHHTKTVFASNNQTVAEHQRTRAAQQTITCHTQHKHTHHTCYWFILFIQVKECILHIFTPGP